MSASTHQKAIAKALAARMSISYSEALRRTRAAADEGLLPTRLAGRGLEVAVTTIAALDDTSVTSRPAPTGHLDATVRDRRVSDEILLGTGPGGRPVTVTERELSTHALLLGATGSGRSTVAGPVLVAELLRRGWSGTILDIVGGPDPHWRDLAPTVAYRELALSDPATAGRIELLAGLDADAACDLLLSVLRFDNQYHLNVAKKILGQLLRLLCLTAEADGRIPDVAHAVRILASPAMPFATKTLRTAALDGPAGIHPENFAALAAPDRAEMDVAAICADGLGALYGTDAGRRVLGPLYDEPASSRTLGVTDPGLTCVRLDAAGSPELTRLVSTATLQRLSSFAAERYRHSEPTDRRFVFVDGAAAADWTALSKLLTCARAAGIAIIVADSGPSAFRAQGTDTFTRLAQNTNIGLIMAQGSAEDARACAQYLFTDSDGDAVTTLAGGLDHGEQDPAAAFRSQSVSAYTTDLLRSLSVGEAVVRVGSRHGTPVAARLATPPTA